MEAEWLTVPENGPPRLIILGKHNRLIGEYEMSLNALAYLVQRATAYIARNIPKETHASKAPESQAGHNLGSGGERQAPSGDDGLQPIEWSGC